MDRGQLDQTRKLLRGVMLIAAATGQDGEQVLDRVLTQPPKKGPTPAVVMRPGLMLKRLSA